TRAGEEVLARWLLGPAPPDEARERQQSAGELRERLDLREDLAVLGEDARAGVHAEALAGWAMAPPILDPGAARIAASALPVLLAASLAVWVWTGVGLPALVAGICQAVYGRRLRSRVLRVLREMEHPAHDLALLAAVLQRIEREPLSSARLRRLRAALDVAGQPPSRSIRALDRLAGFADSRDHLLVRALGPLVLYGTQVALAVEAWRRRSGAAAGRWIEAVGEIEALGSLAGYAYEHPADPFPELLDGGAVFQAEGLGHPLLPEAACVRNDVRLGTDLRLLIVSGSNMSGKSTLLRTVGVNAVLAMAGAPVRARRLRMTGAAVGATIRVTDSLQDGKSRFYAEITRLRQFVDLTPGPPPLLFLFDELLQGTNSHDRRLGAEAILRGLVRRGAIGLITTHDLALTEIAAVLAAPAANVHFEDHFEEGRMTFDYRLRPGVVEKSNALELMRSVGLEV
ncbi:MAG: DNA mismatch repair protein MutS, partial [Acidobacteria bacterium]|nr:DNA mismatch repair protein MutS [Acidobacteriota bacterium]